MYVSEEGLLCTFVFVWVWRGVVFVVWYGVCVCAFGVVWCLWYGVCVCVIYVGVCGCGCLHVCVCFMYM